MSSQRLSAALRQLVWERAAGHCEYCLDGAYILPQTAVGRVTVRLLNLNHPDRVRVRRALIEAGRYP